MKLSTVAFILSENLDKVRVEFLNPQPVQSGNLQRLNNLTIFKEAVENIASTGLFGEGLIDRLKELSFFSNSLDTFDITAASFQELSLITSRLYIAGSQLMRAIYQALPSEAPDSIYVKLPKFQSLSEMSKVIKTLDNAFAQGLVNKVGGKVEVDSVEPGSIWLLIAVGVPAAATLIGTIVWAGVVIAQQMNSNALLEQEIRKRSIQNDMLEGLVTANKSLIENMVESEARLIHNENFQGDHEQLERLKLSIESFASIIQKGGEVHPALHAPDVVKVAFPPLSSMKLLDIESRAQKLAQNASANTNGQSN